MPTDDLTIGEVLGGARKLARFIARTDEDEFDIGASLRQAQDVIEPFFHRYSPCIHGDFGVALEPRQSPSLAFG